MPGSVAVARVQIEDIDRDDIAVVLRVMSRVGARRDTAAMAIDSRRVDHRSLGAHRGPGDGVCLLAGTADGHPADRARHQ